MLLRHDRIDSILLVLTLFSVIFLFQPGAFAQSCTVDAQCNDGDPCTANACVDNVCVSTPTDGCLGCGTGTSANCQPFGEADVNVLMAEVSVPPNGAVHADDFVPATTEINSVCVWGAYLNSAADTPDCAEAVKDRFRVVIYADADGTPDATQILGIAFPTAQSDPPGVVKSEFPATGFENQFGAGMYAYTLTFDTITLPVAGVTYWLEVTNNTDTLTGDTSPSRNTCYWHWTQAHFGPSGNRYAATGTSPTIFGHGLLQHGTYTSMSGRWTDLAFCLNGPTGAVNFTAPPAPTAACCDCAGGCMDNKTLEDCVAGGGVWQHPLSCSDAEVCTAQQGDDCASGVIPVNEGLFGFDTTCATVDTPAPNPELLGSELWYCYTSTSTGLLTVSMCPSTSALGGFDGQLRVYSNPDDPFSCPCPDELGSAVLLGESGEGCNGLSDGGSGVQQVVPVSMGKKYLISVGGSDAQAAGGRGFLDLGIFTVCGGFTTPPTPERLFDQGPISPKNRFLSFSAGDAGVVEIIRVKANNLPPPFDAWNGTKWFVMEPFQVCENSAQGLEVKPPNCGAAPGQPQKWFWAARLTCDPTSIEFQDWTELRQYCTGSGESCDSNADCAAGTCGVDGVLNIVGPQIVPTRFSSSGSLTAQSEYIIQSINFAKSINNDFCFSVPATSMVQSVWGDVVGLPGDCPVAASNGTASLIGDVTETIKKFSNLDCAPKKTRVDVHPTIVNYRVDISDVLMTLGAFSGAPYPFTPGDLCAF